MDKKVKVLKQEDTRNTNVGNCWGRKNPMDCFTLLYYGKGDDDFFRAYVYPKCNRNLCVPIKDANFVGLTIGEILGKANKGKFFLDRLPFLTPKV